MNNVFSLKRFCAYFLYDLRQARNNYLLTFLILGLSPLLIFIVYQMFAFVITGKPGPDTFIIAPFAASTALLIAMLTFPTVQYGKITEKKAGSLWLLVPASTFEKWLSLVVLSCLVLPLALALVFCATDGLLSLIFPDNYGYSFIHNLVRLSNVLEEETNGAISFNVGAMSILQWSLDILVFTLGAVVFKKSKAAKTILCLFAFGIIMSNLSILAVQGSFIDVEAIVGSGFTDLQSFEVFMSRINWLLNLLYAVGITALLGGIYYRIRTIQH